MEVIVRVPYIKFLGVILDENLSWKNHVEFKGNKISSALYSISRLKQQLPEYSFYHLFIGSNSLYNIECYFKFFGYKYNVFISYDDEYV